MTLDLRRSEHGEYLTASPFQAGRCVWPGCTHPRSTDFTDEHNGKTYGLPLCPIHALETYHIVGRSRVMSNNRNSIDRGGKSKVALVPEEGWIYYVRSGDKIKIGHTTRLKQRIRAYPPDTHVLAVHRGSRTVERDLHAQFQTYRTAGREWYDQGQGLIDHINAVLLEYGPPPADVHPKRVSTGKQAVKYGGR